MNELARFSILYIDMKKIAYTILSLVAISCGTTQNLGTSVGRERLLMESGFAYDRLKLLYDSCLKVPENLELWREKKRAHISLIKVNQALIRDGYSIDSASRARGNSPKMNVDSFWLAKGD